MRPTLILLALGMVSAPRAEAEGQNALSAKLTPSSVRLDRF